MAPPGLKSEVRAKERGRQRNLFHTFTGGGRAKLRIPHSPSQRGGRKKTPKESTRRHETKFSPPLNHVESCLTLGREEFNPRRSGRRSPVSSSSPASSGLMESLVPLSPSLFPAADNVTAPIPLFLSYWDLTGSQSTDRGFFSNCERELLLNSPLFWSFKRAFIVF